MESQQVVKEEIVEEDKINLNNKKWLKYNLLKQN